MENGAYTLEARTIIQTISAPGWSSILCSLDPVDTGIIDNSWEAPWYTKKPLPITPITGNSKPFPCIFEEIKTQNNSLKTHFYYNWDWFFNLANQRIPGSFIDNDYWCNASTFTQYLFCDGTIVSKAVDTIKNGDFDVMVLYLCGLDETGHQFGWGSPEYEAELGIINNYLGDIKSALIQKGIFEETYILITSDHGGTMGDKHHGAQRDDNIIVPWIIYGPNVKKNYTLKGNVHNMDSMPNLLYALGMKPNSLWRGNVFQDAFIKTVILLSNRNINSML